MKIKGWIVADNKCLDRPCFVPFQGNGLKICRLYELGKCKIDDPDSSIESKKKLKIEKDRQKKKTSIRFLVEK